MEADKYCQRMRINILSKKEMIKESLCFLSDKETPKKKYTELKKFDKLYSKLNKKIKNINFKDFSDSCREIFSSDASIYQKASLYMLLKKVGEISLNQIHRSKKLKKLKKLNPPREPINEEDERIVWSWLMNIDKGYTEPLLD
jgi:hypothetical protein